MAGEPIGMFEMFGVIAGVLAIVLLWFLGMVAVGKFAARDGHSEPYAAGPERQVKRRTTGDVDRRIGVLAVGERGAGGANSLYRLVYPGEGEVKLVDIPFHAGDPRHGIRGVTNEALIDVIVDRLTGFESGPGACSHNRNAIHFLSCAQQCLQARTGKR